MPYTTKEAVDRQGKGRMAAGRNPADDAGGGEDRAGPNDGSAADDGARRRASGAQRPAGVPAVLHTAAILRHLQSKANQPMAMTELARDLQINNSTCFNILRTLAHEGFLDYDPDTRRYRLGMGLVELASMVDDHGQLVNAALIHAEQVAEEVRQACLIVRKASDDSFVVVGKADGPGSLKLTATVGDRLPPYGAVLGKAYFAWCDEQEVDRMLQGHGLPARTESSITGYEDFKRELDRTRQRGYSVSVGEYYDEYNAVGVPVLDPDGRPSLVLCVTGLASRIPPRVMPFIGARLRRAAMAISRDVYRRADRPVLRSA
ncbi:MAG: transcriptional regulator, IclR family [Solirubrobacterales bacterium]|nr:transcriptional regulator, IclR family [Solirubrobacterales bacterium]